MKQGVALENSASTSPQDLQTYSQQPPPQTQQTTQCPGHYIYQQAHSPIAQPTSPVSFNFILFFIFQYQEREKQGIVMIL